MANVTVKGIPDDVCERIKDSARAHRRSMNSEIIVRLERSLASRRIDPEAALARVDRLRERLNVTPLTDDFLNEAKREGRP